MNIKACNFSLFTYLWLWIDRISRDIFEDLNGLLATPSLHLRCKLVSLSLQQLVIFESLQIHEISLIFKDLQSFLQLFQVTSKTIYAWNRKVVRYPFNFSNGAKITIPCCKALMLHFFWIVVHPLIRWISNRHTTMMQIHITWDAFMRSRRFSSQLLSAG